MGRGILLTLISVFLAGCNKPEVIACKSFVVGLHPDSPMSFGKATVSDRNLPSPEAYWKAIGREVPPDATGEIGVERFGRVGLRRVVLPYSSGDGSGHVEICNFEIFNGVVSDPASDAHASVRRVEVANVLGLALDKADCCSH